MRTTGRVEQPSSPTSSAADSFRRALAQIDRKPRRIEQFTTFEEGPRFRALPRGSFAALRWEPNPFALSARHPKGTESTNDSRSTSVVDSAGAAGDSFVHSKVFEWLSRAGFVARGLIYGIIGVLALKLALGHGGKLTNQQGALHTVAHQPFGKLLLTIVANSVPPRGVPQRPELVAGS